PGNPGVAAFWAGAGRRPCGSALFSVVGRAVRFVALATGFAHGSDRDVYRLFLAEIGTPLDTPDCCEADVPDNQVFDQFAVGLSGVLLANFFEQRGFDLHRRGRRAAHSAEPSSSSLRAEVLSNHRASCTRCYGACTLDGMAGRINVSLDPEYSEKLSRLAARMHVQEGTLAKSLLSTALDGADPDAAHIVELLDGIPGAYERTR